MAIDLYWDDESQTVLLAEFGKNWSWDDLHAVLKTIKRMSVEQGRIFGAIVDIRNGLQLPGNLLSKETLSQFQRMTQLGADGKGPVVIVGMNSMLQRVLDAVKMVDSSVTQDVFFAPDMQQARPIIYGRMQEMTQQASA